MRTVQNARIAAPPAMVWDFVRDIARVATCVPGVDSVRDLGGDRYAGVMRVSLGPIRLALAGEVAVTERIAEDRVVALRMDAADAKAGGSVAAQVRLTVTPDADGETTVLDIVTESQVMGRIGEFGLPFIKRKADQVMTQFADNLGRAIADGRA